MTEDELDKLIDEFEDAAIDYGEHRHDNFDPNLQYTYKDLIDTRNKLRDAVYNVMKNLR